MLVLRLRHVSSRRADFFWRRRVYGDSCKTFPFRRFQNKLSCHFAWQAWHFVTFSRVCKSVESRFVWQAQYFCVVFRRRVACFVPGAALWVCPSSFRRALCTPHHTPHFTPHSTHYTAHFTLLTPHFTLHTLHSTLYTPHSTL